MGSVVKPLLERFEDKYIVNPYNGCWDWTAGKTPNGYGRIKFDGKTRRAHRISYKLFIGAIPKDQEVMHSCNRKGCVNPKHLFLGTMPERIAHRNKNGRTFRKLTPSLKALIVEKYTTGNYTQASLAAELSINETTVWKALKGSFRRRKLTGLAAWMPTAEQTKDFYKCKCSDPSVVVCYSPHHRFQKEGEK